jgi:hypothetical protein
MILPHDALLKRFSILLKRYSEWYQTAVTTICARAARVFRHTKRMSALGQKQNICSAKGHVRFTPNSDRKSGFPQRAMSALPLKADMCSAPAHVCFGPIEMG